jgi:hypothetical protein
VEGHGGSARDRRIGAALLALILAGSIAVRVQPMLAHPETRRGGLGIFGDSLLYVAIAANLADGKGFTVAVTHPTSAGTVGPPVDEPVITRGPVYPFFVASVQRLERASGYSSRFDTIRYAQAVLEAFDCVAVFAITRVLVPGSRVPGLLAALLTALCPYTVFYTRVLLKETVATSLLTWTMLGVVLAMRDRRVVVGALAGIGSGLLALCTPQFLPWGPLAAGCIVVVARHASGARATAAAVVLAWLATIAPWTLRNYRVFDRFVPVSTGDLGYSLFVGTFESNTNWTGWNEFPDDVFANAAEKRAVLAERDRFLAATEIGSIRATESDRVFTQLARERIVADPLGWLSLGLRRLPRLWFQFYIPMYAEREASGVFFLCYFAFGVWAVAASDGATRRMMLPIVVLFLFENAVYLPLHVEPRQATPLMPSLLSLTAIGVFAAWRAIVQTTTRTP